MHRLSILVLLFLSCNSSVPENDDNIAGNDEVAAYIKTFEGRGELSDSSSLTPAQEALKSFSYPSDLKMELVLSEPQVTQPVNINFDARGRLWVVQYNQYPYPKNLKIVKIDEHLRSQFDKKPAPPPINAKGADKITFFEDTDGDGRYDKAVDAISGLNIATSVAFGRGKIWVLNPPYLLAYADKNGDGLPEGDPVVHLDGFGLEDTHATANSLTFGPDGWLYGAQGSTTTATINSSVTKNVHFKGQAIWRYHPATMVFEIFAEGGGNTYHIELDSKGRIYSGDNGTDRGQYYKQGAFYTKILGKHGLHTNPYAFGHLPNMKLTGDKLRFTHGFIRYEGNALPPKYNDRMIAINPLQNFVLLTRFEKNGSTFSNVDEERIIQTKDRWFRPVDIKLGPDGGVYIADWSDSRLSHIDPRDTWNKQSGRIYALRGTENKLSRSFDIARFSMNELINLLSDRNKWFRQQAIQQFADRKNSSAIPALKKLFREKNKQQLSLETLWALNLSGGFDEEIKKEALNHPDPSVRMWAVRLIGDENQLSANISAALINLAKGEKEAEVRSQLAATCKRLPVKLALQILNELLTNHRDENDPDIPLQTWWAIESKCNSSEDIINFFNQPGIWKNKMVQSTISQRLMKRFYLAGGTSNLDRCAQLLNLVPDVRDGNGLIKGLQESLAGRDSVIFTSKLSVALERYKKVFPSEVLTIELRRGNQQAFSAINKMVRDKLYAQTKRLEYIKLLGEVNKPEAMQTLLSVLETEKNEIILQETINALQHYEHPVIAQKILNIYPAWYTQPKAKRAALSLLASREDWAKLLVNEIQQKKINSDSVPVEVVTQLRAFNNPSLQKTINQLWARENEIRIEQTKFIERTAAMLKNKNGDAVKGKTIYMTTCGGCHKLFGEGQEIGPELTGYDRNNLQEMLVNIVDPDAYIREGFVKYSLTTKDGRTLSGQLKSRNSSVTSLQLFTGNVVNIANNNISELEPEKTSLMPKGLLQSLTDTEIKDLYQYLSLPSSSPAKQPAPPVPVR